MTNNEKMKRISIQLPKKMIEELDAIEGGPWITRSEKIREAVRDFNDKHIEELYKKLKWK